MPSRPYHHNNLRAVLLEEAEEVLQAAGAEKLSLRDLARRAGVSHGAPRSHFVDRQALLDALAERGFDQLTEQLTAVIQREEPTRERFRRLARTHVIFAVEHPALVELMFATKVADAQGPVHHAATRLFEVLDTALATPSPARDADDARERFKMIFAATLQGTATLITTQRVSGTQADRLTDDAINLLLDSQLGRRVLPEDRPES